MKLYRVRNADWFGTQAEAKSGARQLGREYDQVEVPTDKPGLLSWLNKNTITEGRPEEGDGAKDHEPDPLAEAEQRAIEASRGTVVESYTAKSNRFEDEFDAMPLALQLHYAARAMENARERL